MRRQTQRDLPFLVAEGAAMEIVLGVEIHLFGNEFADRRLAPARLVFVEVALFDIQRRENRGLPIFRDLQRSSVTDREPRAQGLMPGRHARKGFSKAPHMASAPRGMNMVLTRGTWAANPSLRQSCSARGGSAAGMGSPPSKPSTARARRRTNGSISAETGASKNFPNCRWMVELYWLGGPEQPALPRSIFGTPLSVPTNRQALRHPLTS